MVGRGWTFWLLAVLGAVVLGGAAHAAERHTDRGVVSGISQDGADAWLGVPYAAPPVGALRFRPPQPHDAWRAPRPATALAPLCPQGSQGAEDCLYLNIWRPAAATGALPVMVFFHGGAFQRGGGSFAYYNGGPLAVAGRMVVVTLNYRLGVLGFLAAPALDAENPRHVSGNYGFLDQQAALRWVRANIASFGGDARNVTIFGESAGANSVLLHLMAPGSAGLFAHAISESPVENAHLVPLADAEAANRGLVEKLGCTGADAAACLRAQPAAALTAAAANPVQDGVVLPRQPIDAFRSGRFNRVPVLIGSNHDEWTAFVAMTALPPRAPPTEAEIVTRFANELHTDGQAVLAEYPVAVHGSPIQSLAQAETDALVSCPTLAARAALAAHVTVFTYELTEKNPARAQLLGPPIAGLDYGDYHTADLPYVFGVSAPDGARVTGKDAALSARVMAYWAGMAHAGVPGRAAGAPAWPAFRPGGAVLLLQDDIVPMAEARVAADHHCGFWQRQR